MDKQIPLEPDKLYHIFNHAVGNDNLFNNEGNYSFFLKKYAEHINPIADTFAYCLMPNHFHLAVRIKPESELYKLRLKTDTQNIDNTLEIEEWLSQQFGNLFNSYAKASNKQIGRRGKLFLDNFRRKLIKSEVYLLQLIHYIHINPVHHGFVTNLLEWKHSSYRSFFSEMPSSLMRNEVIEIFGDLENFRFCHKKDISDSFDLGIE